MNNAIWFNNGKILATLELAQKVPEDFYVAKVKDRITLIHWTMIYASDDIEKIGDEHITYKDFIKAHGYLSISFGKDEHYILG